mmetsp:Transcript_20948/g.35067  ORF Transcript_20948/g.35067 Transcript_20948/m.35067 type:complete len:442 (-) Transcript_20948:212-1537(-)
MSAFLLDDENNLSMDNIRCLSETPLADKDNTITLSSPIDMCYQKDSRDSPIPSNQVNLMESSLSAQSPQSLQAPDMGGSGTQRDVEDEQKEGEDTNTGDETVLDGESGEEVEETEEQKREREDRESQELAWQLMQQDNMEMYNMQVQFMQENADHLSNEDFQLMQQLVGEGGQPQASVVAQEGDSPEEGEDGDEGDPDDSDASNWDYERLLALGQQIGDVKTERWRLRAKQVIDSLPRKYYKDILGSTANAAVVKLPQESQVCACADAMAMPPPAPTHQSPSSSSDTATTTSSAPLLSPAGAMVSATKEPKEAGAEEQSSSNKKRCVRQDSSCVESSTSTSSSSGKLSNKADQQLHLPVPAPLPQQQQQQQQGQQGQGGGSVDRCVICMEDFDRVEGEEEEEEQLLVVLPCTHYFHIACAEGWLADHNMCPCCKAPVAPTP